jgi:hypothetical protein
VAYVGPSVLEFNVLAAKYPEAARFVEFLGKDIEALAARVAALEAAINVDAETAGKMVGG